MRITSILTIFAVIGLFAATAYGQGTSTANLETGISTDISLVENQATAESTSSRVVRDQVDANKFIGSRKDGYFPGNIQANGGISSSVGTSGITRSNTTAVRASSTRTSANSGNTTRTTGTGSTANQIPYYYIFETEREADPDLVRLNGPTAAGLAKLQSQIDRLPKLKQIEPVTVEFDGRTAIIKGVVRTERDRSQLGILLGMQPGVWSIQNEVTVAN